MSITYDTIEPYLVHSEVEGSKMYCEFKVPGTEETIQSEASIKRLRNMKSEVERVVKRTATNQLRRSTGRILRRALGRNILGRTVSMAFNTASRPNNLGGFTYSNEEKRAAMVEAFKKVADHFPVDQNKTSRSNRKISINKKTTRERSRPTTQRTSSRKSSRNESGSPFENQLMKYPIKNHFDQEILARMLVELANADRNISAEEREFLGSFISPEIGSINQLLSMDPISPIECEEVSAEAKKSIYMLTWTVSLIDYSLNPSEKRILMEYADMFQLSDEDANDAVQMAKAYALEQSLTPSTSRSELYDTAKHLEISDNDALRIQIQWKKRL